MFQESAALGRAPHALHIYLYLLQEKRQTGLHHPTNFAHTDVDPAKTNVPHPPPDPYQPLLHPSGWKHPDAAASPPAVNW